MGFEETNPSRFYTSFTESRGEVSSGISLSTPNYLELIGDTVSAMAPTDLGTLDPNAVAAVQLKVKSTLAKLNFTTSAMLKNVVSFCQMATELQSPITLRLMLLHTENIVSLNSYHSGRIRGDNLRGIAANAGYEDYPTQN